MCFVWYKGKLRNTLKWLSRNTFAVLRKLLDFVSQHNLQPISLIFPPIQWISFLQTLPMVGMFNTVR